MSADDETSTEDDGFEDCIEATVDSDIEIDQESLPHYLTAAAKRHEQLNEEDVLEEEEEMGCGNDSDFDADELDDLNDRMKEINIGTDVTPDDTNEIVLDSSDNFVYVGKGTVKDNVGNLMKIASVPDDWVTPKHNEERGEPEYINVDNPGEWDSFVFRPKFKKEKGEMKYNGHYLPSGCVPVPVNEDGHRKLGGWEFHYKGWQAGMDMYEGMSRKYADFTLLPNARMGYLDKDALKKLGMSKTRMDTKDFLFFYQLLLPICDISKSGIANDPRLSYYSNVEEWSNMYACKLGLGGTYGHAFKNLTARELMVHDGCIVRDGVRGGNGAIHRRWMNCADYDDDIFTAMPHRRWLQAKRVKKLCNNDVAPKKGEEGYDPCYKYDYIYKVIVHNINELSKRAELDITGDETSWATASPGEAGAGVTGRIMGKPGVSKGGQTVIISDSHRIRPRAYMHRHKLHEKPPGWTAMGPIECKFILDTVKPMCVGEPGEIKKLYY